MSSNVFMNNQLERIADYIDAGKAGGGSLTIDLTGFGDMQGATAGQAGAHGLVPAPAAGDENKVLSGAGTWIDAGSGGELGDLEDVTITSPTSGESLKYDGSKWVNGNVTAELPDFIEETSGSIVTVNAAERPAKSLIVAITPVQSGSGDPSPDNIRPIIGWTGVTVTRCGKNKITSITEGIELTAATGVTKANTIWYVTDYVRVEYGKTFYLSGTSSSTVCYYDKNKTFTRHTLSSRTITPQDGEYYVRCNSLINGYSKPQIEEGTEATAFSPFGTTYSIPFHSEAGTVYGGTLDAVNGTLTVTKANIASYDGETLPGAWISDRDVYAEGTTPTTGAQVVYDLDTPITYQLTPTEIQMLLGTNNIWADTGEVKELKYIPQTYDDLLEEVTSGGVNYSTSEQNTGLKWIDGKTIYQKTINFTVAGGGYISNPTGITGIDTLIKHEGIGRIPDFIINETAYNNPPTNGYSIAIMYSFADGELHADYRATTEAVGATFFITLWYTKI